LLYRLSYGLAAPLGNISGAGEPLSSSGKIDLDGAMAPFGVVPRIIFVFCMLIFGRGIGIVGVIASYVVARREAPACVKTPEMGDTAAGGTR
jgi:hypothetical protein